MQLHGGRIPLPYLAYLRALSEGVAAMEAARRYLGLVHGHEAGPLHVAVIDYTRAVAKRAGLSAWRLLGIEITVIAATSERPTLNQWLASQSLDGWSEAEVLEMYEDAFADWPVDTSAARKSIRAQRLLARRLELIRHLEKTSAVAASLRDPIDGWFGGPLAANLVQAGVLTLGDLQAKVRTGGRWWAAINAVGPLKARRLEAALTALLPQALALVTNFPPALPGLEAGFNRAVLRPGALVVNGDAEAIDAWVSARARSPATELVYRREAMRFKLFCNAERRLAMSGAGVQDCKAYLDFLSDIPDRWISRHRAHTHTVGWAPFRGQLSASAKKLALTALQSMFSWLCDAGYLASNPWVLVSRRMDDAPIVLPSSRSIPRDAMTVITDHLDTAIGDPSALRLAFVLRFGVATGLRPAELLAAKLGHITDAGESGLVLSVVGKGGKARLVPLPPMALKALNVYLVARGLSMGQEALREVPLVASTLDPVAPVAYRVFLRSYRSLIQRAIAHSALPVSDQHRVMGATLHWLRHTHAVRFVEAGGALDVLQENLGHSDSKTTALYYQGELTRRASALHAAFEG